MPDKLPLRYQTVNSVPVGFREYATGDTIPISHGGTGATTAADARSNLGAASTTHNHDSSYATITHTHDSSYASTTHNHDSSYANITHSHTNYLRQEFTTLTDGATINMDGSQYFTARVTLAGTGRTLNINNMQAGQVYRLVVLQDSTGSRTITTWNCYTGNGTGSITLKWAGGSAPTLTTAASKADIVTMLYADSTVWADCVKNF